MQDTSRTIRLKQLYYRSWHRGCKETDLLFGRFADTALPALSDAELNDYETLLEAADSDIWLWFTGQKDTPAVYLNSVWEKLKAANEAVYI